MPRRSALPPAHMLRASLDPFALPMWEPLQYRDINNNRVVKKFGNIMRKFFYVIMFSKYAKEGIRRALAMHAMLKRLHIPDLRAKIYNEAKVMSVKKGGHL